MWFVLAIDTQLNEYLWYNEQTNCLRMYKRLLTSRLHGKAAEL